MGSIGFPARVTPIFNGESVCQVVQAGVSDFPWANMVRDSASPRDAEKPAKSGSAALALVANESRRASRGPASALAVTSRAMAADRMSNVRMNSWFLYPGSIDVFIHRTGRALSGRCRSTRL